MEFKSESVLVKSDGSKEFEDFVVNVKTKLQEFFSAPTTKLNDVDEKLQCIFSKIYTDQFPEIFTIYSENGERGLDDYMQNSLCSDDIKEYFQLKINEILNEIHEDFTDEDGNFNMPNKCPIKIRKSDDAETKSSKKKKIEKFNIAKRLIDEYDFDFLIKNESIIIAASAFKYFKETEENCIMVDCGKMYILFFKDHILSYGAGIYYMGPARCQELRNVYKDVYGKSIPRKAEDSDKYKYIEYVVYNKGSFNTSALQVKKVKLDVANSYNDDFPDEKIKQILEDDNPALIMLHGEPGTGKSYYIRHLIGEMNKRILFVDSTVFCSITDSSFFGLLKEYEDSIIILEDCESLLEDRVKSANNRISALLNLTDGILGDGLRLKFICTFNANITKLDKALLRKGRLKLKYEFKKLSKEKSQALIDSLGYDYTVKEPMTIADIYNLEDENILNDSDNKQIGFIK